ncbi:MAG: phage major capsid protein [Verrucomicrobia bacterium]|nr:phage major capsid protein [Verrucomicrobiota bacterium]
MILNAKVIQRAQAQLAADPQIRNLFAEMSRRQGSGDSSLRRTFDLLWRGEIADVVKRLSPLPPPYSQRTAVTTGGEFGAGLVPTEAADFILELAATYGAYRTLNVRPAASGRTRFPVATAVPSAVGEAPFLKPLSQASQLVPVATVIGSGADTEARELPVLLEVANPLLEDSRADLSFIFPDLMAKAIAARIDWACFGADGSDDVQDGGMSGIFGHVSISAVSATSGKTQVDALDEESILKTVDAVADAALQRGCRWWIHPALFKKLLRVRNGSGAPMVQFQNGEAFLVGWPITTTTAAPSTDAAGNKVLAFGGPDAYLVAIAQEISVLVSDGPRYDFNVRQFRATTRVWAQVLDASWFATLKLAAE